MFQETKISHCSSCGDDKFENTRAFYNARYADNYRACLSGNEIARSKALEHFIKKRINTSTTKNILDYGCGSGLYVPLWKKLFYNSALFFCDISTTAIKKLNDKYSEFTANSKAICDSRAPFDDDSFDVILSVEVIEHVKDIEIFIRDIYRLLKPGGSFVFTTPCGNYLSIEHLYSAVTRQIEKTEEGYLKWKWEDPSHIRRLKSKEIMELLLREGFKKTTIRFRSHFFSFVCTVLLKRRLGRIGEKLMCLDYSLLRALPNGASMVGLAVK